MQKKKQIIEDLKSRESTIVLNALSYLRKHGKPEDLSEIIELLHTTRNHEIKESVSSFLCDLKDQNSVFHIAKILKNEKYKNEYAIIVSSCWQTGLDYSEYLNDFTDIIINENYMLAFEAFTVIENMNGNYTTEEINVNIKKIEKAVSLKEKEKNSLYAELIMVFKSWKKNSV